MFLDNDFHFSAKFSVSCFVPSGEVFRSWCCCMIREALWYSVSWLSRWLVWRVFFFLLFSYLRHVSWFTSCPVWNKWNLSKMLESHIDFTFKDKLILIEARNFWIKSLQKIFSFLGESGHSSSGDDSSEVLLRGAEVIRRIEKWEIVVVTLRVG